MPSILGTNLVDSLVNVIDSLRSSLNPAMGVRQYNVTIVKRTWSGGAIGDGTASFTRQTILDPQPSVTWDERDYRLDPNAGCGLVDAGFCTLREVSLTLTEAELLGTPLAAGVESYYRITDAHGQGIQTTYWVVTGTPEPDREKDIGWIIKLRRYEVSE